MSNPELFCSESCEQSMRVRSFGICPDCGKKWDGHQPEPDADTHYRNNAWKICVTCSKQQRRCVKCGDAITRASV